MGYNEFQLLMIFWHIGLVDTFSVIKLCVNTGSQYVGIVLSSAAGNTSNLSPRNLLEPILGLSTGYQFVQAAATAVERKQRIATLALFLAASGGALTADPCTNAALGSAIASKISYMKRILARGGSMSKIQNYPKIIVESIKPLFWKLICILMEQNLLIIAKILLAICSKKIQPIVIYEAQHTKLKQFRLHV